MCSALPSRPLYPLFKKCRILVLQHPHEMKRANCSLPLVDLCLFGRRQGNGKDIIQAPFGQDFVMKTIVARRFGDHCDREAMKILRDPNEVVVLVFPHKLAMDFDEGFRIAEERCCTELKKINEEENDETSSSQGTRNAACINGTKSKKITLVFIDATWKHAKEMDAATEAAGEWPRNLIRVQMTPSSTGNSRKDDSSRIDTVAGTESESKTQGDHNDDQTFIQRRFLIRTPPSPDHLSTAESVAWIASRVENNPLIYENIMKVLDYLVELWKGFTPSESRKRSGKPEMSQKKLKISHK